MPIRPENRHRYPADWKIRSLLIRRHRAKWRCECDGRCGRPTDHVDNDGRCRNHHGQPAYGTGSTVVLTVAHLDHIPEHCQLSNLMAMCQGCHLHYDREHHAETRRAREAAALAERQPALFALTEEST